MTDYRNLEYLKTGTSKQQQVHRVLTTAGIMEVLASYSPVLTGTIPIAIDTDQSDLDIICHWIAKDDFKETLLKFSSYKHYELIEKTFNGYDTVMARFIIDDFPVEIFGQNRPVEEQEAYRHMIAEAQILALKGESFRQEIITLKKKGIKTEPAFGILLGLKNPYEELLSWTGK